MIRADTLHIARVLKGELIGENTMIVGCGADTRSLVPGTLFVAIKGERLDGHDYLTEALTQGAGAVLIDNLSALPASFPLPVICVTDTVVALGQLACHWRRSFNIPVIGITGSNGKTTVKEMVSAIFSSVSKTHSTIGNLNNHIGVPLTLLELDAQHRYSVIEMGANHPGEIAMLANMAQPNIGIITHCAPAHLAGFESMHGVACAKGELYTALPADGVAIINTDDPYAPLWQELADNRQQISFGLNAKAQIRARELQFLSNRVRFLLVTPHGEAVIELRLLGEHNARNALAASAVAMTCGMDIHRIQEGLANTVPVMGRLQMRCGLGGATVIDDTYNANPGSLKAGLKVLAARAGERWLVLGDMAELGEHERQFHREAGESARAHGISRLYGCGPLSAETVSAFGGHAQHFHCAEALSHVLRGNLVRSRKKILTVLVKGSRSAGMESVINAIIDKGALCS